MKTLKICVLLFVFASSVSAQLKVDSIGRVYIGNDSLNNFRLMVGREPSYQNVLNTYRMGIESNSRALFVYNDTTNNKQTQTLQYTKLINNLSSSSYTCYGNVSSVKALGKGKIRAVTGCAIGGNNSIGVFGTTKRNTNSTTTKCNVGVLGSTNEYNVNLEDGVYAGYFLGDVRVTGTIYGTVLSPTTTSSNTGLHSDNYSERGNNEMSSSITESLRHIELLKIPRINNDGSLAADKEEKEKTKAIDLDDDGVVDIEMPTKDENGEPTQTQLSAVSYGLAADQLKEVYPELVYEDAEGNYSINYIEMVPLLVQSIKELSAEIARLKGKNTELANKAKSTISNIEETKTEADMVRMDQNKPNPFSGSTVINLNIPEKIQNARIFIYDLNGKEVKNILVNERGTTNITIYASDLAAGMYIYCLVVDGKQCVTRRMIVEK